MRKSKKRPRKRAKQSIAKKHTPVETAASTAASSLSLTLYAACPFLGGLVTLLIIVVTHGRV
jgi:hypothetical protein